jgi:hypothetical protein
MLNNLDWSPWDLETLGERVTPRTSYQPSKPLSEYLAGYPHWQGRPSNEFFRLAWRALVNLSNERTLHAALLPPGPGHVLSLFSATSSHRDLAIASGMWASLPIDFLAKAAGKINLKIDDISRLPHPSDHELVPELILRALRLNCLTADYSPLWEELFDVQWTNDAWTLDPPSSDAPYTPAPLGDVQQQWTMATPLRKDFDRRQALVEIDALAAVMLGITAEELCAIYRTQFGVLRKYERQNRYDANGRKVPGDVVKAYQPWQAAGSPSARRPDLGRYRLPFVGLDREVDMTRAHHAFTARLATHPSS